ncbi:MAG: hypothetical protein H7061_12505 [Bdellovibrionaceae bacterium]|nr:hypothetical protein [Bdellovibrio sp.]
MIIDATKIDYFSTDSAKKKITRNSKLDKKSAIKADGPGPEENSKLLFKKK